MSHMKKNGDDDPADAVDPHVAAQYGGGRGGAELHPAQCERDQGDDDQGVEYDGREHGGLGAMKAHDVQRVEHLG